MKKIISGLIALTMMLSSLPAFAGVDTPLMNHNFSDSTGVDIMLTDTSKYSYTPYSSNVWGKRSFEGGIGDKAETDIAMVSRYNALPAGEKIGFKTNGIIDGWEKNYSASIATAKNLTREFSFYYEGDPVVFTIGVNAKWNAKADVTGNPSYGNGETAQGYIFTAGADGTLKLKDNWNNFTEKTVSTGFKPGNWYRLVYTLNLNEDKISFYLDGSTILEEQFSRKVTASNAIDYNYYDKSQGSVTSLFYQAEFTNNGTATSAGCVAMDDYLVYEGAYDNSAAEAITPSFAASSGVMMKEAKIFAPAGTSYADFMAAINTTDATATKVLYTDLTKTAAVTEGNVAENNILVITSTDGRFSKEYMITTDAALTSVNFENNETWSPSATSSSNTTGVGGKAADDNVFKAVGITQMDFSTEVMGKAYTPKNVTMQFQMYVENAESVTVTNRSYYNDGTSEKNDSMPNIIQIDANGDITLNEGNGDTRTSVKGNAKPNEWNTFTFEYDVTEDIVKVYVNGEYLGWSSLWRWHRNKDAYEYLGNYYTRMNVTGTNATAAFDNYKISIGSYTDKPEFECTSEDYTIANGVIYAADEYIEDVVNALTLTEGYDDIVCYTNNTYTAEVDEILEAGNVLVFRNADGTDIRYLTVASSDAEYGTIALTKAEDGKSFTATVTATAPTSCTDTATLYLAIFNGDRFVAAIADPKTVSGDVTFTATYTAETLEGLTAKAMLWESETLTPLAEMVVK